MQVSDLHEILAPSTWKHFYDRPQDGLASWTGSEHLRISVGAKSHWANQRGCLSTTLPPLSIANWTQRIGFASRLPHSSLCLKALRILAAHRADNMRVSFVMGSLPSFSLILSITVWSSKSEERRA